MSSKDCSICLTVIENDELELDCNHKYHKECIETWLLNHIKCPYCRQEAKINGESLGLKSPYISDVFVHAHQVREWEERIAWINTNHNIV